MVRFSTISLALFLIISGAAAGRLNEPTDRNEYDFGLRRDGNGPTRKYEDDFGMRRDGNGPTREYEDDFGMRRDGNGRTRGNEDNFGMRRDGNGPTGDSLGMTQEERDRMAMCAKNEEPILFETPEEVGEAQKMLMTMAEDLNKLALAVKTQVLLQTEEMAIGLDDVEALDEGRADPNDPDIKEELDNLEVDYKKQGGKVMSDLKTIHDIATCIEKGMKEVVGSVESRHM